MDERYLDKLIEQMKETSEVWDSLSENQKRATVLPKSLYKLTLIGKSSKEYKFKVYPIDVSNGDFFEKIKIMFPQGYSGIYYMTHRYWKNEEFKHKGIYLGLASNLYERLDDHHTVDDTLKYNPNSISVHFVEKNRLENIEKDILDNYEFPINVQLQKNKFRQLP